MRPRCRSAAGRAFCRDRASAARSCTGTAKASAPRSPISSTRRTIEQRYGKNFVEACGPELTIQDWGVTYEELEPYYDRFEYLCGVSGKAGNIKGQIQPGGNPFEAPRSREYPNPAAEGALFRRDLSAKARKDLGYHPYPQPSSNLSRPYTNPEGLNLQQCVFCGFCERYACEHFAKASPQTIILPALLKRSKLRAANQLSGTADQSRQHRQEGDRRHLCRRRGCRV